MWAIGYVLVHVIALSFFLVVAVDLVRPKVDVRDFGRDGVDGCVRVASEVRHRLCSVYLLRAGGVGILGAENAARRYVSERCGARSEPVQERAEP